MTEGCEMRNKTQKELEDLYLAYRVQYMYEESAESGYNPTTAKEWFEKMVQVEEELHKREAQNANKF
jgi:hypothetical protein